MWSRHWGRQTQFQGTSLIPSSKEQIRKIGSSGSQSSQCNEQMRKVLCQSSVEPISMEENLKAPTWERQVVKLRTQSLQFVTKYGCFKGQDTNILKIRRSLPIPLLWLVATVLISRHMVIVFNYLIRCWFEDTWCEEFFTPYSFKTNCICNNQE